jgi:Trypsin-like peptidase domain
VCLRHRATDDEDDLALLQYNAIVYLPRPTLDLTAVAIPPLRADVHLGEPIEVYGFPLPDILAASGNFTTGTVSALAGPQNDTRYFQISAPVQLGNSGGPVLDQYGNFVGVVVAKLPLTEQDVPQNVNFAIKAEVALAFLRANGIQTNTSASTLRLENDRIAERAKLFSWQIVCTPQSEHARPPAAPQTAPQQAPPPPPQVPTQKSVRLRVTQDLNLRTASDPHSAKVSEPPNDFIPKDAMVELHYTDLSTDCRRHHVAGAVHTIWCPVIYGSHAGWVNAFYLDTGSGRLSCSIDQTSFSCEPALSAAPAQKSYQSSPQQDTREQCKAKAKGAQFFCIIGGYDPAYCLEYRLRVQQVCEQDQ